MEHYFLNKQISGIFTIPSGLITTDVKVIERIANQIPEIGVITTKSISLEPRQGNKEPILIQYAPGCFMNAVGLTNPGAEEFVRELEDIQIPEDKFLLISIFGKDLVEFVEVAKKLAIYADGLELNFSCPHAKGYGMAIGQDKDLVREITLAVKNAVNIPVIPKLTPNVSNLGEIAKAAAAGKADAICAINTLGPGYYTIDNNPVLTNIKGGMSGKGILPIGLKCVKEISESVNIPIIGCGGIGSADDIRKYQEAGASIFGIGSSLAGLSFNQLKEYFSILNQDLEKNINNAVSLLKEVDMNFRKYKLVENKKLADDLSLLIFDRSISIKPGQFVFSWIPKIGEKPFSVLNDNPLTLAVQKRGCFTEELINSEKGREIYFRGPYGIPLTIEEDKIVLVGGGCGLAALFQIARDYKDKDIEVFIGAKDKEHLFYINKFKAFAKVNIATEDGSKGYQGMVTDLLEKELEKEQPISIAFFNCGPEQMIEKTVEIEKKYTSSARVYNSIDYVTKCGVGLCGSCTTKQGKRLCVDGPFISN